MGAPPVTTPSGQPLPIQPGDYTSPAPPNAVTWQTKRVGPPSPIYVQRDDILVAAAATSQGAEVVTINYRLLLAEGTVKIGQLTIAPPTGRSLVATSLPLAEGWLLSVSAKCAVATTRGQTFARVFLNRAALGQGEPGYMLMADYVTTAMAPSFPNGRIIQPVEGPGTLSAIQITGITTGHDWIVDVPTNARWRIQCVTAQLVTSAVVANRLPQLVVEIAGFNVLFVPAPASIAAGKTVQLSWQPGGTVQSDAQPAYAAPLPDGLVLGSTPTAVLSSLTQNIQAGDQWTGVQVAFEEWLDNV